MIDYYGTTINESDDLIEAKEAQGDLIDKLVNDVFVALDDSLNDSNGSSDEQLEYLQTKTEIFNAIVGECNQAATRSCKTIFNEFATIMDSINDIDIENNISSYKWSNAHWIVFSKW